MKDTFKRHAGNLKLETTGLVLDVSRTALLIVDMTREGLHGFTAEESQAMIDRTNDFMDQTGIRPIYCNTAWEKDPQLEGKPEIQKRAVWGERAHSIEVAKKMQSGFRYDMISGNISIPSDLDRFLKQNDIIDIMVVGVERPLCTWDTAVDGPIHGYRTHFVNDLNFESNSVKRGQRYFEVTPDLCAQHNVNFVNSTDFVPVLETPEAKAGLSQNASANDAFPAKILV